MGKKKKELYVLYVITKLELGGAQKVCLQLFNELPQEGVGTHLISGAGGPLATHIDNASHAHTLDTLDRTVSLGSLWSDIRSFKALVNRMRMLKKKHPHLIVHTHSTKAGLMGRWAAWCAGIKTRIHTIHGYAFHTHQRIFTWFAIYLLELITSLITSHYICVSSEDVKTGIRLFPHFRTRHTIIRAAVDWNQFYIPARAVQPFPEHNAPFIFGTISCFKPQKNLVDLLRAFNTIHNKLPNTRLEIIGDGTLRTQIETWISEHSLNHAITLHGWQHEVAPLMRSWHAFVLSSLWEGLPCAVVEARLLHLPVIAYNTGGIHDVISTMDNGLLYKPRDWQSLAEGMHTVATNKPLYTKLQQHTDNLQDFNNTRMVTEHIQLYKELMS